ncbi:hypothetical protein T440DRAFT_484301 [Plenodomus tracheiphilus IPT5]|uniref:BZIP domain-containing protein n=1 Tax=Plenodomus tracheiphilus IPT5 TaxID=1408161 RepID=A0A6A7AMP3_9PLEO|nr:hypothetical protein T440DRAFT_484301 [Plenodomus tracheiphilus IPT5]
MSHLSAVDSNPSQDDWSAVKDPVKRRKIQNRIAQRIYHCTPSASSHSSPWESLSPLSEQHVLHSHETHHPATLLINSTVQGTPNNESASCVYFPSGTLYSPPAPSVCSMVTLAQEQFVQEELGFFEDTSPFEEGYKAMA